MSVTVKKSGPGIVGVVKSFDQLKKIDVLVGIPASTTMRKGAVINNASLLYIHSKGSPLNKTPPRPVLEPSIEKNKGLITPHLKAAAKAVIVDQNSVVTYETISGAALAEAQRELELAGTIAANGAKRYVLQGHNLAPNAPSTIKRKGSDRPLVDTTRMVGAITSVVRVKK